MSTDATACATCAQSYSSALDPASEKPLLPGRHLDCCGRSICARCLNQNRRYETYCPYCQITSAPSSLPQGLRDPPAYSSLEENGIPPPPPPEEEAADDELPPYSASSGAEAFYGKDEKRRDEPAPDVLHFVSPEDTLLSLSLAYKVPINALRKTNNIYADHLVQARRTVLIPGEYYKGGVSLSPRPLEGEEEEIRKGKVRRWMMACKVAEYDIALLYLRQADWNTEAAIEAFREDERWEEEHPIEAKQRAGKGKGSAKSLGMRRFVGAAGSSSSGR